MLKNRGKHFRGHVDAYMPRELPSKREQQARDADKPDRPSDLELATPKLGKPPTPAPLPSLEQMREELVAYGEALPGRGDAAAEAREIGSLHVALRAVQHAKTAIDELEGDPLPPKRGTDLPLTAYASQLASFYKVCARQSVMDQKELAAWADYDDYCHLQADAVASRAERTQRNKSLKQARLAAGAWERNLRSVYNYIFKCAPSLTPPGLSPLTPHPSPSPLAPRPYKVHQVARGPDQRGHRLGMDRRGAHGGGAEALPERRAAPALRHGQPPVAAHRRPPSHQAEGGRAELEAARRRLRQGGQPCLADHGGLGA
jgi:hypothetical protein